MRSKDLLIFLVLELFAIVWAGSLFSLLESKILAGALAGTYFVLSGLFMLWRAIQWPRKWRSLTWYLLFIHVFVISVPMLASRALQATMPFENVRILGLPGPAFHQLSSYVFSGLIAATVIDWARTKMAARRGHSRN
jgi:hypothetical protein